MKNRLNKTFSLLVLSFLTIGQTVFAQQGDLDTTFGTNNTGIYQDDKPSLPLPMNPVDRARYYGVNEVLADGKIIVAGSALGQTPGNSYFFDFVIRRLNANGTVDTSFGSGGDVQTTFYRFGAGVGQQSSSATNAMKVQPSDGKIIVASQCGNMGVVNPNDNSPGNDLCLIRYNPNGTIDTTFGGNTIIAYAGNINFPPTTYTMAAGKVFTFTGTNFINTATQGSGGTPVKIQIAPDGRIFVFGNSRDDIAGGTSNGGGRAKGFVAVYSPSGALQNLTSLIDTTGSTTAGWGETQIYDGDILSNGDFIAVGYHRTLVSSNPSVFSANRWKIFSGSSGGGFLETNVNAGGSARSLTMLRSNKIMVGGQTGGFSQNGTPTMVRYNGDLTVDTTFGTNGRIVYDGTGGNNDIDTFWIGTLRNQPDGKILGTTNNGNIARFNPNGSLDRSWAKIRLDVVDTLLNHGVLSNYRFVTPFPVFSGSDQRIFYGGVNFRPNGKLVTAGSVGEGAISGPSGRGVVTQIKSYFRNGGAFSDLNNDGKAEISVFRPSTGVWHQLDSFDGAYSTFGWGLATDKLAPADYDGDGRTDRAVFRDGTWYIFQSGNGQVRTIQWGSINDLPRPGDFNGDGQADIAVFRPTNGTWYILYSNPIQPGNITTNVTQFGASGDVPLMGDFDGDGKSDIAVFRNGIWYILQSSNAQVRIFQWGITNDIPVVGDYDADGKADIAVFRAGTWFVIRSSDGSFFGTNWGTTGDKPVPADFDNDGRTDLGVYRNGTWYVLRSDGSAPIVLNFGLATDTPLQAAYLP